MPTGWLCRRIEADLSGQMGVPVRIEAISLSWRKGIRVSGLQISSPAEFGDVPLLTAEELTLPFALIDLIFRDEVDWIRVHKPTLNIVVNESNGTNLSALWKAKRDIEFKHLLVEGATARVNIASLDNALVLSVDRLEFRAGQLEEIASVSMAAQLLQQRSNAPITLSVDSGTDANTATRATFTFDGISLADLTLPSLLDLPLDRLEGMVTGSLDIYVSRQGAIERCILILDGEEIAVTPSGEAPLEPVHKVHLLAEAAYDPISSSDMIEVHWLELSADEMLSLEGGGRISTDIFAGNLYALDNLNLSGHIDPAMLRACMVARKDRDEAAATVSGRVDINDLHVERGMNTTRGRIDIDASLAEIRQGGEILKPAGRALTFKMGGGYNDLTDRLTVAKLEATLGSNWMKGSGAIGQFPDCLMAEDRSVGQWLALLEQAEGEGRALFADIPALAQMTPQLAGLWDDLSIENLSADESEPRRIRLNWSLFAQDGRRFLLTASIPRRAIVTMGRSFVKPPNQGASLMVGGVINGQAERLDHLDVDVSVGRGQLLLSSGQIWWGEGPSPVMTVTGDFSASGIDGLLLCYRSAPKFAYGPIGHIRGDLTLHADEERLWGHLACHEVDLAGELAADEDGTAGGEGAVFGEMDVAWELQSQDVRLTLDASDLAGQWTDADEHYHKVVGDRLVVETNLLLDETGEILLRGDMHVDFGESRIDLGRTLGEPTTFAGLLVLDETLLTAWPTLAGAAEQANLSGQVGVAGDYVRGLESEVINVKLHGLDLAWNYDGQFIKSAGTPLEITLAATVYSDLPKTVWNIERCDYGPISLTGSLSYYERAADEEGLISQGRLDVSLSDASQLADPCPVLPAMAGGGRVQLDWLYSGDKLYVGQKSDFDELQFAYRGRDIWLSGPIASEMTFIAGAAEDLPPALLASQVQLKQRGPVSAILGSLMTDGLAFDVGGARGYLVADISQTPEVLTGEVHLLAETIDTQDLVTWLTGEPLAGPEEFTLTQAQMADLSHRSQAWVDLLVATLPQSQVVVYADIDRLRTFDTMVEEVYELSNAVVTLRAVDGQVSLEYAGGLSSGTLSRSYTTDLTAETPTAHFVNELRDVVATPSIAKQIEWTFPGNRVTGLFNHHEDLTMSLQAALASGVDWRYPTYAVGEAQTLALRGTTRGQAAPDFITNVFPDLDTAEYAYDEMSAQAVYQADGTVVNDVVFSGRSYDMYMEGVTDSDHIAEYEIGIILLSDPQTPEWNHLYRQGRIPVLDFEGRIEWGEFVDVSVEYPWPTETLYSVFLKNNYFYRLWVVDQERNAIQRTETVLPPLTDHEESTPSVTP